MFDEWWIYKKSTWMYSLFTNLELLSLVLGCFTYISCRNTMANYVSGLPTLQGITWLLGWGWPAWLVRACDNTASGEDTSYTWSGRSMGGGRLRVSRQTSPGMLHTDTQQHTADLQDGLSELQGCEPHVTSLLTGALNCRTSIWKWLSPVPMEMTDTSIPIFL